MKVACSLALLQVPAKVEFLAGILQFYSGLAALASLAKELCVIEQP